MSKATTTLPSPLEGCASTSVTFRLRLDLPLSDLDSIVLLDTLPLPTRHLSASEVLRFRDQAFQRYFSDERVLAFMSERFGVANTDHIREMTAKKLERRYA